MNQKNTNLFFVHLNPQNVILYNNSRTVVVPPHITKIDKLREFLEFNSIFGPIVVYEVPLYFLFELKDLNLKNSVYIMTTLERSTTLQILNVSEQLKPEFEQKVAPVFSNKYINDWYHSKVERRNRPLTKYTHNIISKLKQPLPEEWLYYEYGEYL